MSSSAEPEILKLEKDQLTEFIDLIELFERVFEMERFTIPPTKHLQSLLNSNAFHAFVARQNGVVVGGLTCYVLQQYYSVRPIAYLYDLAVDPGYQRQGMGSRLVEEAKLYYRKMGFQDLFVQAELEDGHAIEFYRSTQPKQEMPLVYFAWTLHD